MRFIHQPWTTERERIISSAIASIVYSSRWRSEVFLIHMRNKISSIDDIIDGKEITTITLRLNFIRSS